jgi:hypothetical protein
MPDAGGDASALETGGEASARDAGDPPDPPLASFAPRSPRVLQHATPTDAAATAIDTLQRSERFVTPARLSILGNECTPSRRDRRPNGVEDHS